MTTPQGVRDAPCGACFFVLGVNLYLEGEPLRARQGSSHVLGGSSVARPGGRDDASIVPYKSFAMFAAIGQGFSAAG